MAKIICIATPLYAPDIGGPATHVALLEQGLSEEFSLKIVKFSDVRYLPKVLRHIAYFFAVLREGKACDVIYALDPVSAGLPVMLAARFLKKPLVLRVGGDYAWEQGTQRFGVMETLDEFVRHRQTSPRVRALQRVQRRVARRARIVIAPSEYLASIVQTWGIDRSRIRVVYSQPEVTRSPLSRSDARKRLKLHEDEEIILSAGRLVPWKGYEGLVDAVGQVRRERPAKLYIAGDGPHQQKLEEHIAQNAAESFTTMLGRVPQNELAVWIAAADIFALNTKYEGLSHAVLEAFAAGTPVITTPVGGNRELIEDGATGLLVAPDDAPMLAAAIVRLLKNRELAMSLADNARASLARFNKEKAIEQLSALFASI